MHIVGISAFYHDSAAALVRDGEILAAAQEERFTRNKHDQSLPINATRYCLEEAGVGFDQVDYVAFYEKPILTFDRLLETYLAFAPRGLPSFIKAMPVWVKEKIFQKSLIHKGLNALEQGRCRKTRSCSASITIRTPPAPSILRRSRMPPCWSSTASGNGPPPLLATAPIRPWRCWTRSGFHTRWAALFGVHLLPGIQGQ